MFKIILDEIFLALDVDGIDPFQRSGIDRSRNVVMQNKLLRAILFNYRFFRLSFIEPSSNEHNQDIGNHEGLTVETYVSDIAFFLANPQKAGDVLQNSSFLPWM